MNNTRKYIKFVSKAATEKRENIKGYIMKIIIDCTRPLSLSPVPARLEETVSEAARAACPGDGTLIYRENRTRREVSSACLRQPSDVLLFVSMSGNFPSWLHRFPGKVILAAVVANMGFVSAPAGYSWLRRHLMNLSFHFLRRRTELYVAADAATKEDIHRYYFIPKEKIGTADDPAALSVFFRSAVNDSK